MNRGVVLTTIIILLFLCLYYSNGKESFGTVLGAAGPFAAQYNQCMKNCSRSDPNNRLLASGNIDCDQYCLDTINEFVKKGVDPKSVPIVNNSTVCERQCSVPGTTLGERRKCRGMCHGRNEVAQWCKELWCPYSKIPEDDCMNQCIAVNSTRNNQNSWSWDFEK